MEVLAAMRARVKLHRSPGRYARPLDATGWNIDISRILGGVKIAPYFFTLKSINGRKHVNQAFEKLKLVTGSIFKQLNVEWTV